MSFTKITNSQLNSRGATILPNQPTISPTALKEEFDAPAKQIVAPAVNNLIDELQAVTSAASLGAVAPTGRTGATVQALLTDISDDLAVVEGSSHSHTNKAQLDKISEDGSGNPLYDGNPIGAGAAWGDITGTLSNQTDLQTALNGKANSSHTHTKSQITDFPSLATVATSGSYNDLSNKPTIPDELSDLTDDSTHRLVTDTEKTAWNGKSTVSWNQQVTTGQQIAKVTIDGTDIDVYAPTGGGGGGGNVDSVNGKQGTVVLDLGDMNDVTFTGVAQNDAVVRNGSNQWVNVPLPLSALTGSYADLKNKPSLATVATSGSYNDLSNKPTIPTVVSTYSSTGTDAVNGTAVNAALQTLDVSDSAVSGKYVSAVSETDGKISVTRDNLPTASTEHSGTASTTGVRKQTITINSVAHDVDGSAYMESTDNSASFVFTNSDYILSTSAIDVYTDTWGDNPSNVVVDGTLHTCTVTFSAAQSRTVRIYIK